MTSKSILRNAQPNSQTASARSQQSRINDIALYHANLIQAQKDAETLILASTETLLDLPSSPATADPTHPSPQDTILVKNSLRGFRPCDYDALIEERNINRRCGYVLCPRPNRVQPTTAKYRILYRKGKGPDALRVVEKAYLEKWCSDDCGRRALYIKVQLKEDPAWTRSGTSSGDLVLLDDTSGTEERLLEGMQNLNIEDEEEDVVAKMKALAVERGDGNAPSRSFGLAEVGIVENLGGGGKILLPPTLVTVGGMASGAVEGYYPKHKMQDEMSEEASDDDNGGVEDIIDTI